MYNECRHILTSGHKCKAAALRGQAFCYYHTAARRFATTYTSPADPLLLPSTEDTAGVQLALNQVLRSLASNRIDRRQAGVYFYGLQLAARLAQKSKTGSSKTVRETDEDSEGYILAPEKSVCEPPADCVKCRRRDFCQKFEFDEDELEELEDRLREEQQGEQQAAEQEAEEQKEEE